MELGDVFDEVLLKVEVELVFGGDLDFVVDGVVFDGAVVVVVVELLVGVDVVGELDLEIVFVEGFVVYVEVYDTSFEIENVF